MKQLITILFLVLLAGCDKEQKSISADVTSPDGGLCLNFELTEAGDIFYSVIDGGVDIVSDSRLGVEIAGDALGNKYEFVNEARSVGDEDIELAWGQNKSIKSRYNEYNVELINKFSKRKLGVEFRVFDDAVAFRYKFYGDGEFKLSDELSEVVFVGNPTVWYSEADFNTYESEYSCAPADSLDWVAIPLIMRRDDGKHIALNQAAIMNYPDGSLKRIDGGKFKIELTPWQSGERARLSDSSVSPWRVIMVSDDAKGILANDVLLRLAPENRLGDVGYCKPMTYVGIWWDYHLGTREWKEGARQGARTYEAFRAIDFAFRNNIGGIVVEGWNKGWDKWGDIGAFDYVTPASGYDLEAVAQYAKLCGVRLIMHHETGGDIEGYEQRMDSAFMLCKRLGISDLKTGHAGSIKTNEFHHSQQVVEHFERIANKAAQYGIALDLHEPTMGSGLERTYPNMMTREAVRGLEWEAWSDGNMPSHTVSVPFTRGLAGPCDYTPGVFDILYKKAYGRKAWNTSDSVMKASRVHSTLAHQLSLMLTIYSPWVMAADKIDNYDNHKAFNFVKDLNPDYDESRYLDAVVGQYVVVARRSGDVWYVGATTNENGRELDIKLDFLGNGEWICDMYLDGDDADWVNNPTSYQIINKTVKASDVEKLKLASGGGAALVFKKVKTK